MVRAVHGGHDNRIGLGLRHHGIETGVSVGRNGRAIPPVGNRVVVDLHARRAQVADADQLGMVAKGSVDGIHVHHSPAAGADQGVARASIAHEGFPV